MACLLVGCASQPHPTLKELKKVPGAELTYPGSVHQVAKAVDSNHKFGTNPAFFGERGFTNDPPSAIFAYFEGALLKNGWARNDARPVGDSAWGESHAFARGNRTFAIGIVSASEVARRKGLDPRYTTYKTVYETVVT